MHPEYEKYQKQQIAIFQHIILFYLPILICFKKPPTKATYIYNMHFIYHFLNCLVNKNFTQKYKLIQTFSWHGVKLYALSFN